MPTRNGLSLAPSGGAGGMLGQTSLDSFVNQWRLYGPSRHLLVGR